MTACGTSRPLTTLRRYSGICSTVSGVPWASSRTACSGILRLQTELADHANDSLDVLDGRAGHDAVAEVEDVTGTAIGGAENLFNAKLEDFNGSKESDRVQVALHSVAVADGAPAFIKGLAPVEADDVGSGGSHLSEQAGGFNAKVDDRHTHLLDGTHEALGGVEG